jgi:CheY-like chemotaxis protein
MNMDRLKGKTILLVEDDDVSRFLMRKIMSDWGIILPEVENGVAALEYINGHHIDLILMDIEMPVINGIETTKRLRSHSDPQKAGIPVIGLSANPFDTEASRYIALGMNDYLTKPVEEQVLYDKIIALLPA